MQRKSQNLNSGLPTVTSMCTLYVPTFVCLFMLFPLPGMLFPPSLYIETLPMRQIQLSHALLQGQSKIPLMSTSFLTHHHLYSHRILPKTLLDYFKINHNLNTQTFPKIRII